MKLEAGKTYVDVSGNLWGELSKSRLTALKDCHDGFHKGKSLLFEVNGKCYGFPQFNISHEYVEPAPQPENPPFELEVGERYFTRDGRLSGVVLGTSGSIYPFSAMIIGEEPEYYTKEGNWHCNLLNDHLDLVRKAVRGVDYDVEEKSDSVVEESTNSKESILDLAKQAVGDRGLNYGKPEQNFDRIANLWNAYLINKQDKALYAEDVACMMILLKVARLQNCPHHKDSIVDVAGYAACLGGMAKEDN